MNGIFFAFIALISWGFGDFFIQKTVRVIGNTKALFLIGAVGFVALFPFVRSELLFLERSDLVLLTLLSLVVVFAAYFDFEALRRGKIAIVEPIIGLELPITVGLSIALAGESLTLAQLLLIALISVGIVLAITEHHSRLRYHKRILEKGVILAGIGAVGMALVNFLVGVSSREISPLLTIWFAHSFLALVCGAYLFSAGQFRSLMEDIKQYPKPILGQSILDNLAWAAFAVATTTIPIAIATAITESYIALAVLLGLCIGRERLRSHQIIGAFLATAGVVILSVISQ